MLKTESIASRRLNEHFTASLQREADAIAKRWRAQGRSIAPGSPTLVSESAENGQPEEVMRAIDAMARSLIGDAYWQDDLIRAGWAVGAEEFRLGASVHAVLRQMDLLEAMVLFVLETAAAAAVAAGSASNDGIATARRIQRARSLLSLAALKGFTEAYLDDVRTRYRILRHDLRNPLGTIRTAVSLMEDESIPADMRANPRFRSMVKRNASTMDSMIGLRLSDETTHEEAFAWHVVSLADVARAVRRDLREDATEAGCEIILDETLPALRMDAMGIELVLRAIISAVLRVTPAHSSIAIGPASVVDTKVTIAVRFETTAPVIAPLELALAEQVAKRLDGRVWIDGAIFLELPISVPQQRENVARASE